MALLRFLLASGGADKAPATRKKQSLYRSPEPLAPQCANANCFRRTESLSARPSLEPLVGAPGGRIVVRCFYCNHELKIEYVRHTVSRRYCPCDISLGDTVADWFRRGELAIFDSIKQAEELGYEPYKGGPQRNLMAQEDIREAVRQMGEQIIKDSEDCGRLVLLAIKANGAVLARGIAAEIEKNHRRKIETGEIEIFGSEEGIHRTGTENAEAEPLSLKDRPVVIVDDVIYTGKTVKSALSIIFKAGRPRSVRLAVLIDRGHREVPVKPNYVGKHIPSSEKERVRVRLREVEPDEKDRVVIYSIINSENSRPQPAAGSHACK